MTKMKFASAEDGGILIHVIWIAVVVAVLALLIAGLGPVVWLRISTIQEAQDVANGAAFEYKMSGKEDAGRVKAAEIMRLMGYSNDEIGQSVVQYLPADTTVKTTVRATVVRSATTFLTRHLSFMNRLARVAVSREASVASATQGSK